MQPEKWPCLVRPVLWIAKDRRRKGPSYPEDGGDCLATKPQALMISVTESKCADYRYYALTYFAGKQALSISTNAVSSQGFVLSGQRSGKQARGPFNIIMYLILHNDVNR
ncbi:hypothetical protein BaRGS_00002262 [Batillaria attramentaria]|uniref:Uncharacterized protein n=1 Tax=Batillaria attramentaria TaxID=370345 RepID=A0ABD0M679_9CAEN